MNDYEHSRQREARIIELPRKLDERGNLSIAEEFAPLPFRHARAYWVYDVPGGELRDGHGYRRNREFIVALSGSFEVGVIDGRGEKSFMLNRSYYGLYVPARCWRQLRNFSTNAVALVLASTPYDESDYVFTAEEFLNRNIYAPEASCTDLPVANEAATPVSVSSGSTIDRCRIIDYHTYKTRRQGNLSVVENGSTAPFAIRRSFWIYDVPGGQSRGGHAHAVQHELVTAASGSFSVRLTDGSDSRDFFLNRPSKGLYIPPGVWIDLHDFSAGAICLAFASDTYCESDNLRDYSSFINRHKTTVK